MVDLAPFTTLGVGGPASTFVETGRREDLIALCAAADRRGESVTIIGGGSNIVISDAGLPGTVVRIVGGATGARRQGNDTIEFTVDAGVKWDDFVAATVTAGTTGVELLSGIPGTVGAAPVQNIAAYGQQVCDVIHTVGVFDRKSGLIGDVPASECGFGFRTSRFKDGDWSQQCVITHVRFRLPIASFAPPAPPTYGDLVRAFDTGGGNAADPEDRRAATLRVRQAKSMVLNPKDPLSRSAGSFFVNPEVPIDFADELIKQFSAQNLDVTYLEGQRATQPNRKVQRIPAALLLLSAGFRPGDAWDTVQLSDKHVLAIVTRTNATADDVWQLSWHIRQRVADETGVALHCEPQFLGEFAEPDVDSFLNGRTFQRGDYALPKWMNT